MSRMQEPLDGDNLFARVYGQLRASAQKQLESERAGHTLSATALVHEAYIKLAGPREVAWQGTGHFYAAAAQAMRRILIDHARAKRARGGVARGGGATPDGAGLEELPDVGALASMDPERILAVDRALERLEGEDAASGAIVKLRFFAGLSVEQAAEVMGVSPRSAARQWTFARARLHRLLTEGDGEP